MRKRRISIYIIGILAFSIFGCANIAEDTSVAKKACTGTHNTSHAGNVEPGSTEETDTADKELEGEAESESHSETFSASGMALRDDTALLVTVTEYVSPTYNCVYEESEYDSEGRVLRHIEFFHGDGRWEYEYDDDVNPTREICYETRDDEVKYWIEYRDVYDAAGNLIKRVDYDYEGNIEDVFEYTYDESGNLLQYMHNAVEYNASGVIEYEYDSAGNMTKEITVPDNQWKEYEYDSENRIIKLTEYLHGEIKHEHEYGYEYRVVDVE